MINKIFKIKNFIYLFLISISFLISKEFALFILIFISIAEIEKMIKNENL